MVTANRASRSEQFEHTVGVGARAREIFTREEEEEEDFFSTRAAR